MGLSHRSRHALEAVGAAGVLALAALLCLRAGLGLEVVKKAAGIPDTADGVGKFINGVRALVLPALVMVAAMTPIAMAGGGLALLFGNRHGMQIIGTALGVLLFLGSITALVD